MPPTWAARIVLRISDRCRASRALLQASAVRGEATARSRPALVAARRCALPHTVRRATATTRCAAVMTLRPLRGRGCR